MSYQQLIEGQRLIQIFFQQGMSYRKIASKLGISHSTISREVRRNSSETSYCPLGAHQQALVRRHGSGKRRMSDKVFTFVELALGWKWSPEQISGVGDLIDLTVSHEWIYRYIRADRLQGGELFKQLRHSGKRRRKSSQGKREIIPNRVGIEERPEVVDRRERLGDWELDTVIGKQGTGAIVSLVERKSRLYLIRKVEAKTAEAVRKAINTMLWRYRKHVHTITADNGTEFCGHELVAEKLKTKVYFAHPYCSWERGLNENFNGLLRQYIPKGTDLRQVTDKQIKWIETQLNLRPRKCLGYKQPAVVFEELRKAA